MTDTTDRASVGDAVTIDHYPYQGHRYQVWQVYTIPQTGQTFADLYELDNQGQVMRGARVSSVRIECLTQTERTAA